MRIEKIFSQENLAHRYTHDISISTLSTEPVASHVLPALAVL